ncbi:hypothetical protein [Spirosoma sp. KUDC1026]|uniref:hypothetical protein n=1 Tax=Spirosoma sp. KUDC1026 TaxID=2745947 RepID=UPI00159BDE5A|nr:hypothetical protein [Spirosoma sp. KUDC1026]QKZ11583.1 hypothetical protein HU175_02635 [Spirosoma sp. KUDC1026]
MKVYMLILLLTGAFLSGWSQTPVQVVTKVVEKEFSYTEGVQRVNLNAQKADLLIRGWNRPTVSVKLRLMAKHPDRAVAEREVAYHQYVLQTSGNQIDLSNRFVIPQRTGKLQSQLKVLYEVNVPYKALLTVRNSFGDIRLKDLVGDVSVTFEYGKLQLDDIGGKLAITSAYGDIDGRSINAILTGKAEKADITLRELGGKVNWQSRYGKLTITPVSSLTQLHIEAIRTDILVTAKRLTDFRYDVITSFAQIHVPETVTDQLGRYGGKYVFTYQPAGQHPEISIQNSYNDVTIQEEKSLVGR